MPIRLLRIDERLLHGQVIVGWGMRLKLQHYIVVDDALTTASWEQDLYAAAVPAEAEVVFLSVGETVERFTELDAHPTRGALLTRGTGAMRVLAEAGLLKDRRINIGGLHSATGRRRALDYVYLDESSERDLRVLAEHGGRVTARDLPSGREVALDKLLDART
jgi:PTS system mannose-specific IIB component/fructoselysine and glucoselysine-specific PTS system IIB component